MAKTKNSSKIIAIISAIILFLSLAFAILPNLDNSTSTQVQASTLTEAQLQQRRNAPGLYQTDTTTLITSWADLISDGKIITDNTTNLDHGTFYVSDTTLAGDLVCEAVDNLTSLKKAFTDCSKLTAVDISSFNTNDVTDMGYMFYECSALKSIDLTNINTSKVDDMSGMFHGCCALTSLDVSNFDTSSATSMRMMFINCRVLTSLDVSNFDTSLVRSMNCMFLNCYLLTSIDVSNFDTDNVEDFSSMFYGCRALTSVDVSNFDTSKAEKMYTMFYECRALTSLDVSNFDTSSVTRMEEMFSNCINLEFLYITGFTISSSTDASLMFNGDTNLKFMRTPQTVTGKTFNDLSLSFESAVDGKTGEEIIASDNMPANTFIYFNGYQPTKTGVATNLFSLAVTGIIIIALAVICFKKKKFN